MEQELMTNSAWVLVILIAVGVGVYLKFRKNKGTGSGKPSGQSDRTTQQK